MDPSREKSSAKQSGKFKASAKLSDRPKNDFALPIYVQRRQDMGVTISCPDMNISRFLPLPQKYENMSDFYRDLCITMAEVDQLAIKEFVKRDFQSKKRHRQSLFPRGLKDHLDLDIDKLFFKPSQAAELTTKSLRTWQWWCKEKRVKRRSNGSKFKKQHYQIPYSEIFPYLKKEFKESPKKILRYIDSY